MMALTVKDQEKNESTEEQIKLETDVCYLLKDMIENFKDIMYLKTLLNDICCKAAADIEKRENTILENKSTMESIKVTYAQNALLGEGIVSLITSFTCVYMEKTTSGNIQDLITRVLFSLLILGYLPIKTIKKVREDLDYQVLKEENLFLGAQTVLQIDELFWITEKILLRLNEIEMSNELCFEVERTKKLNLSQLQKH